MGIYRQLIGLRQLFFDAVSVLFQKMATNYGFPENTGLPLVPTEAYDWTRPKFTDFLAVRKVPHPPESLPTNYLEILLGTVPRPDVVPRVFYESKSDGYYSYYVENFKNLFFLPSEVSEFLQIRCGFCVDLTFLEICHQTLFCMLVIYGYLISLRICLGWMIMINPYAVPAIWLTSIIDWVEDISYGFIPIVGGLNVASPLFSALVGKLADSLNHLILTMPYLPCEKVRAVVLVDGSLKHVLKFRYLPILWYKYPIPNDIRYYWYTERLDILVYMQKAYEKLNIQFLPNEALTDLSGLSPGIFWKSVEDLSTLSDFIN